MKLINWSLSLLLVLSFTACKKMDSKYSQYIVDGGITYPGKPKDAEAFSGKNRVKISWLRGADPSVTTAKIFWNNFTDSLKVNIPNNDDEINVIIDNLPEKLYSFIIKTYNNRGDVSVPVELIGGSYGERYQSQLLARPINKLTLDDNNKTTISWGNPDLSNGAVYTEVKYTDVDGNIKTSQFPISKAESIIEDLKIDLPFQYRTVFRPDSLSIDDFYTENVNSGAVEFSKKNWTISSFSTQHDTGVNAVKNFIDGTDATRWHSKAGTSKYPHFAVIDMGITRTITQFGVWRTTFENGGDDRAPNTIQFLTSIDNITWVDQGTFDFNRLVNGEQTYTISSKPKARYFKFVAVSGPESNMVMGEISAYGY